MGTPPYDVVVVGSGAAGAVIAARITERADRRVLLVEAGPDYPDLARVPEDLLDGRKNSIDAHDWGLVFRPTSEQKDAPLPRGKVVGGSTAVNTCIALRGEPEDYDEWAAMGLDDWSWSRCLPAFVRLERDLDFAGEIHGSSGPLPIRRARPEELTPIQAAFLRACAAMGHPASPDHNAPGTVGHGPHPMNRIDGRRVSVAEVYLHPARSRPNLSIRASTLVRRVVVGDGRAVGVEVEPAAGGPTETIACGEIVLSAGAIHTPAILVRSGIGPRATLERLGVPVAKHAPGVGARLLDHPGALIALVAREGVASFDQPMIQTALRYTAAGSDQRADMLLQPLSFLQLRPGMPLLMGLAAVVQKARGHGRLEIVSADPRDQPRILPDFLNDARDKERLVDGVALALETSHNAEIAPLTYGVLWPTAQHLESKAAIAAWIRSACGSGYHPSGTAPMGATDDGVAVVDGRGRVFGVKGLVVADASIMPTIPRANTNLPTIMIGERFGEWLRDGN